MDLRTLIMIFLIIIYVLYILFFSKKLRASGRVENRLETIRTSGQMTSDGDQMSLPITQRLLKPVFDKLVKVVGSAIPLNKRSQEQLNEALKDAGIKKTAAEYFATQAAEFVILAAIVFVAGKFILKKPLMQCLLYVVYALAIFYVLARFSLKKKGSQRADRIENEMPEILDLLSVSVSAGLGFDQALQYVTERCDGDLSAELAITQREIRLGRTRNEALKALAERCKVQALHMFVSAIIQADTLGIAISNILEVQADNARQQHKQRIEEKAAKLPVKILLPLVFFIFPNIFIILLGPAIPQILNAF